jgi:hypothetical protein
MASTLLIAAPLRTPIQLMSAGTVISTAVVGPRAHPLARAGTMASKYETKTLAIAATPATMASSKNHAACNPANRPNARRTYM